MDLSKRIKVKAKIHCPKCNEILEFNKLKQFKICGCGNSGFNSGDYDFSGFLIYGEALIHSMSYVLE